jgi:hypothetical protein
MPADPNLIPTPNDPNFRLYQRLAMLEARVSAQERSVTSPFLAVHYQIGANAAYKALFDSGQGVYVDNAQAIPLQWVYTPTIDAWVEFTSSIYLQSTLADWSIVTLSASCTPAPVTGQATFARTVETHSSLNPISTEITTMYAVAAGVQYTFGNAVGSDSGANNNQYYQGPGHLWMIGKAWAR